MLTGIGTTVTPLLPVDVLKLYEPVDVPVPTMDSAVPVVVALALDGVVVIFEASEEAALDKMPENSEAKEPETLESVAVATMLESSELKEDAISESAAEGFVVVEGADPVVLADASEITDEATLETSDATDETTLLRSLVVAVGFEVIGAVPVPV